VKFCSLLGGLTGLFTFGLIHLAIFLFPIVMALAMRKVARWSWMPSFPEGGKPRRGLGLIFLAPFLCLLLAFPFVYLLLIPLSILLAPFALLFHSSPHTSRNAEEVTLEMAGVVSVLAVLLIYCWLLARSLKRFTGLWQRGLFVQLIAWIGGLAAVGILFLSRINSLGSVSATFFWLSPLWVLSILALSRAGAIFGQWLARSA
jgi:hypothetical protein